MIIRQALNFTAHLAAGAAVGALAYVAWQLWERQNKTIDDDFDRGDMGAMPTEGITSETSDA